MFLRLVLLAPFFLLSACASDPAQKPLGVKREPQQRPPEWRPVNALILRYDANGDGNVSRAEMDTGLKTDFAADDADKDGKLDAREVDAINRIRWSKDASAASPLIDWNNDGVVSLREYSSTIHSLFEDWDKDGDGLLTPEELRPAQPKKGKAGQKRRGRKPI